MKRAAVLIVSALLCSARVFSPGPAHPAAGGLERPAAPACAQAADLRHQPEPEIA
jgi:hypothetical protein